MSEWTTGYATIVGQRIGKETEACERQEIRYRIDGAAAVRVESYISVGPVTTSVVAPRLAIFTEPKKGKELCWFMPPPGAGMMGTYVVVKDGQEINYP
jgi:hypothetical protein